MASGDGFNLDKEIDPAGAQSSSLSLLSVSQPSERQRNADLLNPDSTLPQRSLSNIGSVYSQVLPELPSAIAAKLKDDCINNTGSTLIKLGESAALGLGAAVLLSRSPVLAKTLLTGAGIGTSAYMLGSAASFTAESASAKTPEEQRQLSSRTVNSLAKFSADLIETTPAFIAGTAGGTLLSPRIATLDSIATAVRNTGEYKLRQVIPQDFHYIGLDAKRIKNLGTNGELDILKAGNEMMKSTPWRGVEDGRFIKAGNDSIKISARIPSTIDDTIMGSRSEAMFHTHEQKILPTSGDFNSVYGTGIVGVPKRGLLTFYEGTGAEAERLSAMIKSARNNSAELAALQDTAEALHSRTFNSLVVDPTKQLAVRVDMRWNGFANRMEASSIQALDFADTVKNLSRWDGRLNIKAIQSSPKALAKPGMSELLQRIATD